MEKQVVKNTNDIKNLRTDVNNNTKKINVLETLIVPELKIINNKLSKLKLPWLQYMGILAIGGVLAIAAMLIIF